MRGKASVNAFLSLYIHFVQWMEEVISVSQRLLAWCSHHKKGFFSRDRLENDTLLLK